MLEFLGRGSISKVKEIAKGRVLLFTQSGIYDLFRDVLRLDNVVIYTAMTDNPKREEIAKAQDVLSGESFDCIVAFGGGSVIDFAKAFRYYEGLNLPLVAVPTTAGTGSQATQFAVVYVNGAKMSLDDAKIRPDMAIIDSSFIEKSPQYLKACCAMDAYAQAIESFWAKRANDESREYAIKAIELCKKYLVCAVNSSDEVANEQIAIAAHLAGKAINISRTTAAHALSYKVTSKYGIPHGHAVALMLPGVFRLNLGFIQNEDVLLELIGINQHGIKEYFKNLMRKIDLEDDFEKLGIIDIEEIVNSVNVERLGNNPKTLTREDLFQVMND